MPQNNDIVATLEDQPVITATVLYPQQRIQAQIDKVYLYNPDAAGRVFGIPERDPIYEEPKVEENA